jgi:NAD(P)H dehydrogenase (quinone)
MKALIIYAHPNPISYCHAIAQSLTSVCQESRIPYEFRDLYAMDFSPVLRGAELGESQMRGQNPEIQHEQQLVREAEWIFMIFPLWWSGMPAILKGYIDRVFTYGFAFGETPDGLAGLLQGKKVLLFTTTGTSREELLEQGIPQALQTIFSKGLFDFCGMELTEHFYFFNVPSASHSARIFMLEEAQMKVKKYLERENKPDNFEFLKLSRLKEPVF